MDINNLIATARELYTFYSQQEPIIGIISNSIAIITAVVGALLAIIGALYRLGKFLLRKRDIRHLLGKIGAYYSLEEIKRATRYYVPTKCQSTDPAELDSPRKNKAIAITKKLIPFFIKNVFSEKVDEKYYIVLADSGMGKTTFMINLFLKYSRSFGKRHDLILLPLGFSKDIDEKIARIENKESTILLLDAFDEDFKAPDNYEKRIEELVELTREFKLTILTSRSQFFPSVNHLPADTGRMKFGVDKGEYQFNRIYVSPFHEKEVNSYLFKKYGALHPIKWRRAKRIIEKSPDLMARPMLLNFIDDLMKTWEPYQYSYQIYEQLIHRWIQRERVKNKEELRKFSEVVALDIYRKRSEIGGLYIDKEEFESFAKTHHIDLNAMEMKSRSLLNRNARGQYKFSHKSILEYLLAYLKIDQIEDLEIDFLDMNQAEVFYDEMFKDLILPAVFNPNDEEGYFVPRDQSILNSEKSPDGFRRYFADDPPEGFVRILHFSEIDFYALKNIEELVLTGIRQTNLNFLRKFMNLKTLSLSKSNLTDISAIKELKNLSRLELNKNQITDITAITELKNLTRLELNENQITDLSALKELKNLTRLKLYKNQITDISTLKELKSLASLDLDSNQFTDISAIKELKKRIGFLKYSGNPY